MSWTQTDLDNIRKAIATGAKSVQFGSGDNAHKTDFRSLDEMRSIAAEIEAALASARCFSPISYVAHSRD